MKRLSRLSIRGQLILVITSAAVLAVVVGFATVILRDVGTLRREMVAKGELIARLAGDYSLSTLLFDDRPEAEEALSKLQWMEEVDCARLFDADGEVFASYDRGLSRLELPPLAVQASEVVGDHLFVSQPIDHQGERYGRIVICASTRGLEAQIRSSLTTMGGLVAILIVLSVGIAFRLQGFISRPILELASVVRRVSGTGDYSIRAERRGDDEIGTLYDAWNDMLAEIERRDEERQRYEARLQATNLKLERYTRELERSNRELDQFAYVVSHDLKAPLRGIINVSNWLEEDVGDQLEDENLRQLKLLRNRTERLEALIEGILEFSRVMRVRPDPEIVGVGELLAEIVEDLEPPPGFEVRIDTGMPTFLTQRVRLRQVFGNLLSNAFKYHHRDGGRVEVTVAEKGRFYEFGVADDGPGIPEDCHLKIFQIFQTLVPRDTQESTGIGLAIVQKIVVEQGGRVTVDSREGEGATFRFTWPKVPETAADPDFDPKLSGRYELPRDFP
jgi:signal transduction histidine kinase